jgi:hypothetical protein
VNRRAPRPLVDELILAAIAQDRATFDRLFDLWFAAVFASARRLEPDRRAGPAEAVTADALRRAIVARLRPTPSGADAPERGE